MFALSRDGERVFLHQPNAGMAVPMLLDLGNKTLKVRVPSIDELEDDYAVYDDFGEMLSAVSDDQHDKVNFARKMSQECSQAFRSELSSGTITVAALRRLVETRLRRAGREPRTARTGTSAPLTAEYARAFSED